MITNFEKREYSDGRVTLIFTVCLDLPCACGGRGGTPCLACGSRQMKLCPDCRAQVNAYNRAYNRGDPTPPIRLCDQCRAERNRYQQAYRARRFRQGGRMQPYCVDCGSTRIAASLRGGQLEESA